MNVLLVSSEALPFSKSGGLADFIFSYGKALVKEGVSASVITPLYRVVRQRHPEAVETLFDRFEFRMSWRTPTASIYTATAEGVKFFFVDMPEFDTENLYGYNNDNERFACFMMAVNTFITRHNDFDVVHCNDWQSAVLPLLLKYNSKPIKTVLTIHNPAFQGWASRNDVNAFFNLDVGLYDSGHLRMGECFNFLKTGIMYADKINTVSKTHASELINDHIGFGGIGAILDWCRHYDFTGIVNGLDVDIWNPETDPLLIANYNKTNYAEKKRVNKQALLHLLGIDEDPNIPLFSAITRLSSQKGVERIEQLFPHLERKNARLIVIGTGEMEERFLSKSLPYSRVYFVRRYDENLAHLLYAASDFFLMPSYFEPCGTSQLISMRYGTLPIVSNVGGLNDTVKDIDSGYGATGYVFDNQDYFGCVNEFSYACDMYHQKRLNPFILNGMEGDYSWAKSAKEYLKLYASIDWK